MAALIVIDPNPDMRDEVLRVARRHFGAAAGLAFDSVEQALPSVEQAARAVVDAAVAPDAPALAGGLVVLGAATPARSGAPPDTERHHAAIEFVDRARAEWPHLQLLVLSAEDNDPVLLRRVEQHAGARLAMVGPGRNWKNALIDGARQAVGQACPTEPVQRTQAVLRINVFSAAQGAWTLERRGRVEGGLCGTLVLDAEEVRDLCGDSADLCEVAHRSDWSPRMERVARRLDRLLFGERNPGLRSAFEGVTRTQEDRPQLRLVFGLQPQIHALAVESLKRPSEASNESEWHALHSPIVRQYPGSGDKLPLFWDAKTRRQPVNCLLVAADPRGGFVDEGGVTQKLAPLAHIEDEIDELAALLGGPLAAGVVGQVRVLKLSQSKDPRHELMATIGSGDWQVVHFAGHSIQVNTGADEVALVLSPEPDFLLSGANLVKALHKTRFLYISSCESAGPEFLRLALKEAVPAVLGYRWKVNDGLAREMALLFYRALFGPGAAQRSLARALMQARQGMFRYTYDAIWAAPLLLTQGLAAADPPEPLDARSHRR